MKKLPGVTLVQECTRIRDDLRKLEGLPPVHDHRKSPATPATAPKPAKRNNMYKKTASNLNGTQLDDFLNSSTTNVSANHNFQVQPDLDVNPDYVARELPANDFFVRFFIPMEKRKHAHIPAIAREMFFQLRRADPSVVIGPMDRSVKSDNLFLNHEKGLPNGSDKCKTYVQGVHILNGKLKISMRIRNNRSYQDLRALLHDYLEDTGITISFDDIESSSVFAAGWFKFAHPRFLNRDRLMEFMADQHHDNTISSKISIYPRQFWEKHETTGRVRTELLYVIGAWDIKEDIMDFLLNVQWQEQYSDITFIPFQTTETFTKEHQVKAMQEHNAFCSRLRSEVLHIAHPDTVLDVDGDVEFTFLDWMMSRCYDFESIFYDVDKIGEGLMVVSYFEEKSNIVTGLLDRVQGILEDEFDGDVIESIFGYRDNIRIRRSANRSAQRHLESLAAKSNPQEIDDDVRRPPRVQILYGSEPIENDSTSTYASAAKIATSKHQKLKTKSAHFQQTSEDSEIAELRASIDRIDQQHKQFKQSVEDDVKEVSTKIDTLGTKINTRITSIENRHSETIRKMFEEWDQRNSETRSLILGMCNGHSTEQNIIQAPSTPGEKPSGVPGVTQ